MSCGAVEIDSGHKFTYPATGLKHRENAKCQCIQKASSNLRAGGGGGDDDDEILTADQD